MAQRLEEYYHDGNELMNRKDVSSVEALIKRTKMGTSEQIKDARQQQHMSVDNPELWTGDFDND